MVRADRKDPERGSAGIRQRVIEEVHLLAHPGEQLEYEKRVPIAHVPDELVCGFCDDLYSPLQLALSGEFTDDELRELAHLYGLLLEAARIRVASVSELLETSQWRAVVGLAKNISEGYERKG